MESLQEHFYKWGAVVFFIVIYGMAILFIPFYKKTQRKPATGYIAFVIAFAIEMHGIPYSMMLISTIIQRSLPEGILWGHTFIQYIGYWGLYLNIIFALLGMTLVISGWTRIYHGYWKKVKGTGHIVKDGVYKYIRHPQYTGLLLISIGMILGWATLTSLIMFPIICVMYGRLAKREEQDMIEEFGEEYRTYMAHTKKFIPFVV